MLYVAMGGFEGQNPLDNIKDSGRQGPYWDWKVPGGNVGWEGKKDRISQGKEYCIFVGAVCTNTVSSKSVAMFGSFGLLVM